MGRVLIFCACYFVVDAIVDFMESFNQDNIARYWSPLSKLLFLFPMAVLDVILLFWCMSALSATLEQLESKQVSCGVTSTLSASNAVRKSER